MSAFDISVGLLGREIGPSQCITTYTGQHYTHTYTDIHICLDRDSNQDPSVRTVQDHTRLRLYGHWSRRFDV